VGVSLLVLLAFTNRHRVMSVDYHHHHKHQTERNYTTHDWLKVRSFSILDICSFLPKVRLQSIN
jgi:hypothetical protein